MVIFNNYFLNCWFKRYSSAHYIFDGLSFFNSFCVKKHIHFLKLTSQLHNNFRQEDQVFCHYSSLQQQDEDDNPDMVFYLREHPCFLSLVCISVFHLVYMWLQSIMKFQVQNVVDRAAVQRADLAVVAVAADGVRAAEEIAFIYRQPGRSAKAGAVARFI